MSGIDYAESPGIFAFIKGQTDSVYCQIQNDTFPDLIIETSRFEVSSSVGIIPTGGLAKLKTYPNPSEGIVYIDLYGQLKSENVTIKVLDNNGKQVFTLNSKNQKTSQLDLSSYAPGIYYIKAIGNKQVYISKVILK